MGLIYQDNINDLFSGDEDQTEVTQEIRLPVDKVVPLALPDEQAAPETTPEVTQEETPPNLLQDETVSPEDNAPVPGQPEVAETITEGKEELPQVVVPELPAEQQQSASEAVQVEATPEAVEQPEQTEQTGSDAETKEGEAAAEITPTPETPTSQAGLEKDAAATQPEVASKQEGNEVKAKEQK
ncbi:MAG: hypothetical protein P8Z39_07460, partial [Gammaproteobacteria bacterium]